MNEGEPRRSYEKEPTPPITPSETSNHRWKEEAHRKDPRKVPTMLPLDHLTLAQIRHVGRSRGPSWLDQHPTNVRPEESSLSRVRIELRVGVAVMGSVTSGPPLDGALDSA